MFIIIVLIAFFVVVWLFGLVSKSIQKDRDEKVFNMEASLNKFSDFPSTQRFDAVDSIITINENLSQIAIAYKDYAFRYNFSDLVESEILQDNTSITKTSRGSQVGGALVGGVLAGGLGAVIGGLSGTQTSNTIIKSLSLRIIVDDLNKPVHIINFLQNNNQKSNYPCVKEAIDNIQHWHSIMSVIINRNEKKVGEG
ncbi:hypothetical protein F4V43_02580 [Paenibacillus spiritus]|uniref:Uncharacterized protein n=1 Tax=Paenibacillus spiritus TaxID=2496557 RepID=A0A5J5GI59_9BACL|nr:hypothetical protein [Paenibacillus spiritus]KAA9007393.1 hypothetical protein F4V43_02580 [Paenibacillus spiritus]